MPTGCGSEFQAEAAGIVNLIDGTSLPTDEPWAVHLICTLAQYRFGALLAASLRWAADEVLRGKWPLGWLRQRVLGAFAVAMGERALHEGASWEGGGR